MSENNIFKSMKEQMKPDNEVLENLYEEVGKLPALKPKKALIPPGVMRWVPLTTAACIVIAASVLIYPFVNGERGAEAGEEIVAGKSEEGAEEKIKNNYITSDYNEFHDYCHSMWGKQIKNFIENRENDPFYFLMLEATMYDYDVISDTFYVVAVYRPTGKTVEFEDIAGNYLSQITVTSPQQYDFDLPFIYLNEYGFEQTTGMFPFDEIQESEVYTIRGREDTGEVAIKMPGIDGYWLFVNEFYNDDEVNESDEPDEPGEPDESDEPVVEAVEKSLEYNESVYFTSYNEFLIYAENLMDSYETFFLGNVMSKYDIDNNEYIFVDVTQELLNEINEKLDSMGETIKEHGKSAKIINPNAMPRVEQTVLYVTNSGDEIDLAFNYKMIDGDTALSLVKETEQIFLTSSVKNREIESIHITSQYSRNPFELELGIVEYDVMLYFKELSGNKIYGFGTRYALNPALNGKPIFIDFGTHS